MNKAYEYRIYPTPEQEVLIRKTIGCARKVYNLILDDNNKYYKVNKKGKFNSPAYYKKDYPYLKDVDSDALCGAWNNLQKAFKNFFKHRADKPVFKSKKNNRQSYTTINRKNSIRFENGKLRLPKVGFVYGVWSRFCEGMIKSVTVKMKANGKFFISVLTEQKPKVIESRMVIKEKVLGIDMSMSGLGVTSNGNTFNPPKWFQLSQKKLKRAQRKLSRTEQNSKRHEKQRIKVATIQDHIANQRKDWLNKLSTKLANENDVVVFEDINLQTMSRLFGKSISQNGFGMFRTMLEYKLKDRLKQFIKADKFFASTQLCSYCGFKNQEVKGLNKLGIREWTCPVCGTVHDRDVNAAKNLVNHYNQITSASATEAHAHRDNVRPRKRIVKVRLRAVANEVRKIKGHGPELCSDSSGSNPSSTRL